MSLLNLSLYTTKMNATGWLVPIGLGLGAAVAFTFGSTTLGWVFAGMLALDFVTGVLASLKRGERIKSTKIRDMFYKWVCYLSILLVAALLEISTGLTWIHGAALGWVILSEGVSCLENAEQVLGKRIPFLGKLKKLLDAIRSNGAK